MRAPTGLRIDSPNPSSEPVTSPMLTSPAATALFRPARCTYATQPTSTKNPSTNSPINSIGRPYDAALWGGHGGARIHRPRIDAR